MIGRRRTKKSLAPKRGTAGKEKLLIVGAEKAKMYNDFLSLMFTEKVIGKQEACTANPRARTSIVDKEGRSYIG